MEFLPLRELVHQNTKKLLKEYPAFTVDVDRDELWEAYLSGFPTEALRQEHNCNACKSFIRQMGATVVIARGKLRSIFHLSEPTHYDASLQAMIDIIYSAPIKDVFLVNEREIGRKRTSHFGEEGLITWDHFYANIPSNLVVSDVASELSALRSSKQVFHRALAEIEPQAIEMVQEMIADGILYRGNEHKPTVDKFGQFLAGYHRAEDKRLFPWEYLMGASPAVRHIRNSVIGNLLVALSESSEDAAVERAVRVYESQVAPSNYKRPKALVTNAQINRAKEELQELGLTDSLPRRFAAEADLDINEIIYLHRSTKPVNDVFDVMSSEVVEDTAKYQSAPEMPIESLISRIEEGTVSDLKFLLEPAHLPKFVSLSTAQNPEAPTMFSWQNHLAWVYTGGVADSIKERVKSAGGRVDGELRVSLSWSNTDDLDLHIVEPGFNTIYYGAKKSNTSGGTLDVDANVHSLTRTPVENVIWTDPNRMGRGMYQVKVNNFTRRENVDSGYTVQIECQGKVYNFHRRESPRGGSTDNLLTFQYSPLKGVTALSLAPSSSDAVVQEKWGVSTGKWYDVDFLTLSPNHWGEKVSGNKHYFFLNRQFVNDDEPAPRGFFNEYLAADLLKNHKRMFEILGAKMSLTPSRDQLSGLGFSETIPASVVVRFTDGGKQFTNRIKFAS